MSWKMKMFFRKWAPVALIASVLFVGYTHLQRGGRASVGSVLTSARVAATKVPVLGTYFKRSKSRYQSARAGRSGKSYAYGKRARRGKARHSRRGRRR